MQATLDKPSLNGHQHTYLKPLSQQTKQIMIISGKAELSETLQIELDHQGYQALVIHDGLRGLQAIKSISPDLIIVSWSPPRLSGVEICTRLRASGSNEPVILLTQSNSAEERIAGLRSGANDCISMPFVREEFIARIQANLPRRIEQREKAAVLQCADLKLNRKTREVFRGNEHIHLTAKEFDLLEYMMAHYFQVLTRMQILENVWGYDFLGSSNIIEVYVRYLRKKLERGRGPRLIHTVRSVGYILKEAA